jgi:hypothetical protein
MKVYRAKIEAMAAIANKKDRDGGWFIDRTDNGWFTVNQRCRSCGAVYVNGRCPVSKRDCGRV